MTRYWPPSGSGSLNAVHSCEKKIVTFARNSSLKASTVSTKISRFRLRACSCRSRPPLATKSEPDIRTRGLCSSCTMATASLHCRSRVAASRASRARLRRYVIVVNAVRAASANAPRVPPSNEIARMKACLSKVSFGRGG
eukprot:scaffold50486_cov76-Phaeocystis_antarctica.AAC.3